MKSYISYEYVFTKVPSLLRWLNHLTKRCSFLFSQLCQSLYSLIWGLCFFLLGLLELLEFWCLSELPGELVKIDCLILPTELWNQHVWGSRKLMSVCLFVCLFTNAQIGCLVWELHFENLFYGTKEIKVWGYSCFSLSGGMI